MIEQTPKGRKTSCGCSVSDTELHTEPEINENTITGTTTESITEIDPGNQQLVSVLERCGECNFHNRKY